MKRALLAVLLIIFSLVFSLFSHFYVKTITSEFDALLEEALADNSSYDTIRPENIVLVLAKWNKHEKFFSVLLKNSAADEMDAAFSELEFFLDYQQKDSLSQAVIKCIFLLKSVIESEKFSFGNIF